jgi:hypothetical protein
MSRPATLMAPADAGIVFLGHHLMTAAMAAISRLMLDRCR